MFCFVHDGFINVGISYSLNTLRDEFNCGIIIKQWSLVWKYYFGTEHILKATVGIISSPELHSNSVQSRLY